MARTSVDMENHTCDDAKCGRTQAAPAGDNHAPAGWITGTASQADADGNLPGDASFVEWEACRVTHVKGAIEGALQREGVAADEGSTPARADEPTQALPGGATRDVTELSVEA